MGFENIPVEFDEAFIDDSATATELREQDQASQNKMNGCIWT
jgi:hypothetical protein